MRQRIDNKSILTTNKRKDNEKIRTGLEADAIAAVLAAPLADAGYQVIPRIDAETAVAALGEDIRIDLIVIDYEMPGLDTLSFMTMLKQLMP